MPTRVGRSGNNRPVTFTALAGAREVGRHSHLLRIGSINILFDPGLHNGAKGHCANYKGINKIDYIFLTHAHTDHIGSLCEVMALFPKARVYATAATKHLVILALRHRGEGQKLNIAKCAAKITPVSYQQDLELKNRIEAVFIPAGHILGSASIIITTPEGKFMITGDYDTTRRGILPPFVPPDIELRALISEGSFVGMPRPSPERERDRLIHLVTKEISAENRIIVAADSLGVFQEYAVYLAFLQTTGRIPQYRLFFNHWLDDSLDVLKRYSQLMEFDVQENQWAGRFEPLGNISQKDLVSDGPYCLFAGPSNLKHDFPTHLAIAVLVGGGKIIFDDRLTEAIIRRRLAHIGHSVVRHDQIVRVMAVNHIREEDLKSVIYQMHPDKTVLVHGMATRLTRFANSLNVSAVVPAVREEIQL